MDEQEKRSVSVVVWKFPFEAVGYFEHEIPIGARIIHVDAQREQPCFWALVDPRAATETRRFYLLGTGHELHDDDLPEIAHVGTFMLQGGAFVGHLFEIGSAGPKP